MTPLQKLKHAIVLRAIDFGELPRRLPDETITVDNIDSIYEDADGESALQDARNEIRCCGQETGLRSEVSRHYETEAVAAQMPDGTWVGWTYFHGGGKHGEPEAMDWMHDAYDLVCSEKEQLVVVRKFERVA